MLLSIWKFPARTVRSLTRHKISDRARERAWLQAESCSYSDRRNRAGRGSLHRRVRPFSIGELQYPNPSARDLKVWRYRSNVHADKVSSPRRCLETNENQSVGIRKAVGARATTWQRASLDQIGRAS